MRIIFMGSPDFSVSTLNAIIDAGHEVVCVYAQPPRPAGRGHQEKPCPVHASALEHAIEVRTPVDFKAPETVQAFADLKADIAVVVAYGLILPKAVLVAPRLGCVNVHASLLPRWRGAAPIQRAIQAGDKQTGICIMQMEEGLDTGPVYARKSMALDNEITGGVLHDALCEMGASLCVEALPKIEASLLVAETQSAEGITYAHKLSPKEAKIDWQLSATDLERSIRAFNPWPGTWFEYRGERIKVFKAHVDAQITPDKPVGGILDTSPAIQCGEGALALDRLQRPGKKPQDADVFTRGFTFVKNDVVG